MRIRKKLIVLHTCFSLVLAGILAMALRPAIGEVIRQAEAHEARVVLALALGAEGAAERVTDPIGGVMLRRGNAETLGLDAGSARRLADSPLVIEPHPATDLNGPTRAVTFDARTGEFVEASVVLQAARDAVVRLYVLFTVALLAVYALVAAALELFVLPKAVYQPIRTMLEADTALQEGRREGEIIEPGLIPADELGEIMRSRNESVLALRQQEAQLADALTRLEDVANDLKRKNHLLENAKQNLADADRLASLGMMSAGIAHELNTPLSVLKGLVEKLNAASTQGGPGVNAGEAALMLRVVGRLERLSESLLDFARVRPFTGRDTPLAPLVDEAWTLVRLDRSTQGATLVNRVPRELTAYCDADRIMQVLVNILRNAVDVGGRAGRNGEMRLDVAGEAYERDGTPWSAVTITDNGPGIRPDVLDRLFEPFVSTRLDSKGTGLGLAVAHGIVREHGGLLLARNVTPTKEPAGTGNGGAGNGVVVGAAGGGRAATGAVFEILLPRTLSTGQAGEIGAAGTTGSGAARP